MQERVYKTSVRETADLKHRLIETWSGITQTVIDETIDEWGLRLRTYEPASNSKQRALTSNTR